jgi:L-alanine-DL-glutamate epimerase-like enolase superfamily enzyme
MRIARIEIYQADLPVATGAFQLAHTGVTSLDTTVVRVVAEDGTVGWGETCPLGPAYQAQHAVGARAALAEVAPGLVGFDPRKIEVAGAAMDARLEGHGYAKTALETALWDLTGRHYGARVCELLGGARRERVAAYYAVSVGDPDESARFAAAKVDEGYARLQIKVGGGPVEADIEAVRAVHDAVAPRARLVVDANRSWTTRDAMLFSQACAGMPLVLEQPCNSIEETLGMRRMLRHPVYLDESALDLPTVLRAIGEGACDGFALKVSRIGGIGAMRAIRDACAARSMPHTCDDTWGGDIVSAACVHVGATVPAKTHDGTWLAAPYMDDHYDPIGGITVEDGTIAVPGGPGLGIDIDPERFGMPVAVYA